MIAVIQRVASASVSVAERTLGSIGPGLVALVGAVDGDTEADVEYIEKRLATLRIFADDAGRMNLSIGESGGALLVISQFTLAADTRKGRRPSFIRALAPELAAPMIDGLVGRLERRGLEVQTGEFGANMQVELVNDGPVTLVLDSRMNRRGNRRTVAGE